MRSMRGLMPGRLWLAAICLLIPIISLAIAYSSLPAVETLTHYQPKVPLRVYTADDVLIGEFGEEHREFVSLKDVPDILVKSILAIEDERFYKHSGVDYFGIVRAAFSNIFGNSMQGASTITQQVARNVFLSRELTFRRKINEVLLAWKIERNLSKEQILELYLNEIYLGQRAYGFGAAAQIYFGKRLENITTAEAAMLAGLPKAPSAYNPVTNPQRASVRQKYILLRLYQLGHITKTEYEAAKAEVLDVKNAGKPDPHAQYVAEMVRQLMYEQFGEEAYTRGLVVRTTIYKSDQDAAFQAVRQGVMNYEAKQTYRGPEAYMRLPASMEDAEHAIAHELTKHPDSDDIYAAAVLEASPLIVTAVLSSGEKITITGDCLNFAADMLKEDAPWKAKVERGAIIRVVKKNGAWFITQMPEVESALVAVNSEDGAIRAMVGGFDFNRNKFNRATQAWRQPGSSFKPFIYSASLERGMSPSTIVSDTPIHLDNEQTGGAGRWSPENYDGTYDGPITMRQGLAKSKNMVSVRILLRIDPVYATEYATRFGFSIDKNRPNVTMALGTGAATPLQMASAYGVFANGGYRVRPYIISEITDLTGKRLSVAAPEQAGDETRRVIDKRNAFIMDSMLKEVVKHGTAKPALVLKRPDIAGKTGTTNHSRDAWFVGYQSKIVAAVWFGFDQPRSLGEKETGGGLALPIWINFMRSAMRTEPVEARTMPEGVIQVKGDYYYDNYPPGTGIDRVGVADKDMPQKKEVPHKKDAPQKHPHGKR
ncbi:MAG TPA: penicillin-binding protein 1A [Noviherbaspirillum sp.]